MQQVAVAVCVNAVATRQLEAAMGCAPSTEARTAADRPASGRAALII